MVHSVIFWMRGWVAFVAFIEYSNTIQCFLDGERFLESNLFLTDIDHGNVSPILGRLFGRYSLLNGVILTHCALFIHHMPVVSLTISALSLSILFYISEAIYYYSLPINFYVVFPTFISRNTTLGTIVCLFIAPIFIEDEPKRRPISQFNSNDSEEETDETIGLWQKSNQFGKSGYLASTKLKTKKLN